MVGQDHNCSGETLVEGSGSSSIQADKPSSSELISASNTSGGRAAAFQGGIRAPGHLGRVTSCRALAECG